MATYTGTYTDYNGNAFVTTCDDHEHDDDDDDDGFDWYLEACQADVDARCVAFDEGWCTTGRSTVAVRTMNKDGHPTLMHTPLSNVKVGDEIAKASSPGKPMEFTKIIALPHSKTTQQTFEITLFEDLHSLKDAKREIEARHNLRRVGESIVLEATAHHKFLRCKKTQRNQDLLVETKDIKRGDCVRTLNGDKLVRSAQAVPAEEAVKHDTYSIVTEGGAKDLIAVGGLLMHATDKSTHDLIVSRDAKKYQSLQKSKTKKTKKTKGKSKMLW